MRPSPVLRSIDLATRILRVNHAGENGAVQIYAAQMFCARLTAPALVRQLREFKAHEEEHRRVFALELGRRSARRCRSFLLCGVGGYVLGLVTGVLGRGAILATTVAVERVVLAHLGKQLVALEGKDDAAIVAINRILRDEQEHHDRSTAHAQGSPVWLKLLGPVVSLCTESVIRLGMIL